MKTKNEAIKSKAMDNLIYLLNLLKGHDILGQKNINLY
jgi:hypothetical protein